MTRLSSRQTVMDWRAGQATVPSATPWLHARTVASMPDSIAAVRADIHARLSTVPGSSLSRTLLALRDLEDSKNALDASINMASSEEKAIAKELRKSSKIISESSND